MEIKLTLNGKIVTDSVDADMTLYQFLRRHKCWSVKCGCETTNCGLCTVMFDDKPMLSCSIPVGRANGHKIETLEGLEKEASEFIGYFAAQGADQCGFCNPGYVVNIVAMLRENPDPTDEEIKYYLAGNLCRCTGFQSQLRALRNYLNDKKGLAIDRSAGVYGEDVLNKWESRVADPGTIARKGALS
ncbi:MAG: 2Fe-2S iron-sulfur cluster-binding protein [Eubacteriales bacterium]|nr:2Fe-2S iron-sulfur cluster-binding protein [Eubacteriales bacterium]